MSAAAIAALGLCPPGSSARAPVGSCPNATRAVPLALRSRTARSSFGPFENFSAPLSAERQGGRRCPIPLAASKRGLAASVSGAGIPLEGGPDLYEGQMLSQWNTWALGGPAKYFTTVTTPEELAAVLRFAAKKDMAFFILGKGSNCLFDDRGFDGVVILNQISFLEDVGDGQFRVGAGYPFNQFGALTSRDGWEGMEFAIGIPGTVGGAVFMNAGANGQEVGETCTCVEVLNGLGEPLTLRAEDGELSWSYRHSPFMDMEGDWVITAATFQLKPNAEARERALTYMDKRRQSQPVTARTAGCVWRNPEGASAGMLIDQLGLKGSSIGGASVSDMHANFLINDGASSTAEMLSLIHGVKLRVKEETGYDLEEEVRFVPHDYAGRCTDFKGMLERHTMDEEEGEGVQES